MTNLEKLGSVKAALAEYNKTNRDLDFATWCDRNVESDYPEWVKPGAKYYHKSTAINIWEVAHVGQDEVITTTGTPTPKRCFVGPNANVVQFTLPDWIRVGAKFKYKEGIVGIVYTVSRIDLKNQRIYTNPDRYALFSEASLIEEVNEPEIPSWVKVGQWVKHKKVGQWVKHEYDTFPKKITEVYTTTESSMCSAHDHRRGTPHVAYSTGGWDYLSVVCDNYKPVKIKPWTIDQAAEFRRTGEEVCMGSARGSINRIVSYANGEWYVALLGCNIYSFSAAELARDGVTASGRPCGTF